MHAVVIRMQHYLTCSCSRVRDQECKGREENDEQCVNEEIAVVDVSTIRLPLVCQ